MSIYDSFYCHLVYPFQQWSQRQAVQGCLDELKSQLSGDIVRTQSDMLKVVLANANKHSEFWRERFHAAGVIPEEVSSIDDLIDLPPLNKLEVRNSLEVLSTQHYQSDRLTATTGGSTAAPMKFYRDRRCRDFREAVRAHYWHTVGKGLHDRWVNVWGASGDLGNTTTIRNRWRNRLFRRVILIPANRLDNKTIHDFVREICRFRPVLLHGYSQSLYLMARLLKDSGLVLPDSIKSVTATAEPLYDEQKTFIMSVLQVPVYRVYGTREFGFIGGELPGCEGLQINPLNAIIEIVDQNVQPVRDGERGQILVTDLRNHATPLIRYQIGDVGIWNVRQVTSKQWSAIRIDAGRETDFILTKDNRFVGGAGLTLINSPGILQFQYVQERFGELLVKYVANASFEEQELDVVRRQLQDVVGDLVIRFESCVEIPRSQSGKYHYVRSSVSRQALELTS